MKKTMCITLAIVILLFNIFANAEETPETDFFGSIGGFFSDTINNAGEALDNATKDATGFFNDVGENISSAVDDVGASVIEFWNSTSAKTGDAWNWTSTLVEEAGNKMNKSVINSISDLQSWVTLTDENALSILKNVFETVASSIGMAGDKATELWDMIYQYSVEKNINMVVLVKLTLAIMVRVSLGGDMLVGEMAGNYIDQVVMDWFADFNIESNEDAENALKSLENSLEEAVTEVAN